MYVEKKSIKAVFVIPFCDRDITQFYDTLRSIRYYVREPHAIVCINDCSPAQCNPLGLQQMSDPAIVPFIPHTDGSWPRNTYGSLFCKKYQAMQYAADQFSFDYMINLDTDALVTGHDLISLIDQYFEQANPGIGMIGSYATRADGRKRTRWQWAFYLLYLTYFKQEISRTSLLWSQWIPEARKHGYKLGRHLLGGAFISRSGFIQRMISTYPYETLIRNNMQFLNVGDDVLFSLLAFACGYQIGDFGRPNDPMAIAQKYLPLRKEAIHEQKKQIIHSVKKGLNGESEEELRSYFKNFRM
ncbi:MAG: hypothetical protein WC539_06780 [Nitrospirota bacterium]